MCRKKDYPKNHADGKPDKARITEGVYAGPDFFAQQRPDPMMFQAVYAGPEFFNPQNAQPGVYRPVPPVPSPSAQLKSPADDPDCKYCPSCGTPLDKSAKFCHECGTPQPSADA